MNAVTVKIFLVFTFFLFVSTSSFSKEKSQAEYYQDAGINFDYYRTSYVNNKNCYTSVVHFQSCIYSINTILMDHTPDPAVFVPIVYYGKFSKRLEQNDHSTFMYGRISPVIKTEPDKNTKYWDFQNDLYNFHKDILKSWALDFISMTSNPFEKENTIDLDYYLFVDNQNNPINLKSTDFNSSQFEINISKVDFEQLVDLVEDEINDNSKKNLAIASGINAYLAQISFDHGHIDSIKQFKKSASEPAESLIGIGVVVAKVENGILINSVLEDGPAYTAGIKQYDIITEINGKSVLDETLTESVNRISGKNNTVVEISILDIENPFEVIRKKVEHKNVDYIFIDDGLKKIGHIFIRSFSKYKIAANVKSVVNELTSKGAEALIIDLRNNPGGFLSAAVEIADIFLEKKKLVVEERPFHYKKETFETEEEQFTDLPLVILQNHRSASASEILSGALADHKRAIIVGERSFGKGTVQFPFLDKNNDKVYVYQTAARFYRPNGNSNQLIGISPHFEIESKKENETIIREENIGFNPVPADGKKINLVPSEELVRCLEETGRHDEDFGNDDIKMGLDYQALFAKDVAICLAELKADAE